MSEQSDKESWLLINCNNKQSLQPSYKKIVCCCVCPVGISQVSEILFVGRNPTATSG